MPMTKEELEQLGEYIRKRLPEWGVQQGHEHPALSRMDYEMEIRERIIRVEEELKSERELMKLGFKRVDERFERMHEEMRLGFERLDEQMKQGFKRVDERFERVDARFERVDARLAELSRRMFQFMIWSFGFTATAAGVIIAVMKLGGS